MKFRGPVKHDMRLNFCRSEAAAGPLPAFDSSVSDEQDAAFFVPVMDCSDCYSSVLDSPNWSWSIDRVQGYLRRKRGQVNGKKAELLERDYLHRHRHLESFLFAFVCSSFFFFFISFSFLFLSCLLCPIPSHLQERSPTSIAIFFLQSCFNAHSVLAYMYIACWPLDRRILHELYFACAANSRVPPAFDREWFHFLANGSQLHAFSQGRAFLCIVVHAHSIGDRRTETSSWGAKKKKRNTDGTASAFRKRLAFFALPWSVMGESTDSWAREGKCKSFGGSAHCIERCFRSRARGSLLLRLDEGPN